MNPDLAAPWFVASGQFAVAAEAVADFNAKALATTEDASPIARQMSGALAAYADEMSRAVRLNAVTAFVNGVAALLAPSVREAEAERRRRWETRILARLATPTEDDRAEAAALVAWLRATPGYVLPLPTGPRP